MKLLKNESSFYELDLYHFAYEYSCNELNCVSQSIAVASSFFNNDYYYLYAVLDSLYVMWKDEISLNKDLQFESTINKRLKNLNLQLIVNTLPNEKDLFDFIKSKINSKIPIIFNPKRNKLSYCSDYGNINNKSIHSIIIGGYSDERNALLLRDIAHVESCGLDLQNKYGLLKLYLSFDMFLDIWRNSNKDFSENKILSFYENKLFTIEPIGNIKLNLFELDFLKSIFNSNILKDKSNLLKMIEEFKYTINNNKDLVEIEYKLNFIGLYMVNTNKVLIDVLYKLNYNNIILEDISKTLEKIYINLLLIIKNLKTNKKNYNINRLINLINIFEEKIRMVFV